MNLGHLVVPNRSVLRHIRAAERLERSQLPLAGTVAHVIRYRLARTWGVFVHRSARIGEVEFAHPTSVVIGAGVIIGDGVRIYQNVTLGAIDTVEGRYPVIEAGVTLYSGVSVLGGVRVGEGAVVGAGSLVLHDVAPGSTVVGSPARPVGPKPEAGVSPATSS